MRVEYETPTMSGTTTDCFAAVRPFIDALDSPAAAGDVQIIGGVSTSALSHPSTEIHVDTKEIIAPRGFSLSRHREDGTLRDVDVLVLSSNSQRVYEVERTLQQTTGNTLERSVFGIRPAESLREQTAHPLGLRALRTFLSDRYDTPRGASSRVKSLFPFAVPLPDETLETWSLIVLPEDDAAGEQVIPVPHPGTTLVNYCTRSISGLRPRDAAKITHVAENVFSVSPDIRSWLIDGPGASQLELGTLIASLRTPHQTGVSLLDGSVLPQSRTTSL